MSALMRPQQEQLVIGVRCILRKEIIGQEFKFLPSQDILIGRLRLTLLIKSFFRY